MHPGWVNTDMGGMNATLTPENSVACMLEVIVSSTTALMHYLTLSYHSIISSYNSTVLNINCPSAMAGEAHCQGCVSFSLPQQWAIDVNPGELALVYGIKLLTKNTPVLLSLFFS